LSVKLSQASIWSSTVTFGSFFLNSSMIFCQYLDRRGRQLPGGSRAAGRASSAGAARGQDEDGRCSKGERLSEFGHAGESSS